MVFFVQATHKDPTTKRSEGVNPVPVTKQKLHRNVRFFLLTIF
jgi:hypothetical protein